MARKTLPKGLETRIIKHVDDSREMLDQLAVIPKVLMQASVEDLGAADVDLDAIITAAQSAKRNLQEGKGKVDVSIGKMAELAELGEKVEHDGAHIAQYLQMLDEYMFHQVMSNPEIAKANLEVVDLPAFKQAAEQLEPERRLKLLDVLKKIEGEK